MCKTVIFDLGGVYFTNGTRVAIDAIAAEYNIGKKAVADILNGTAGDQYRVGKLSAGQFWLQAKTSWNIDASSDELSLLWNSSYRPDDGTVSLVERLKNGGFELLYLSDNTAERVAYLDQKYSFLQKFDDGIFSHVQVTVFFRLRIIYRALAEKKAAQSHRCFFRGSGNHNDLHPGAG